MTYQQNIGGTIDNVTYTYDTANRLKTVADTTGTFSIQTDSDGRPSQITFPTGTGVIGSYSYTKSGKPDDFGYAKSGSGTLLNYVYDYKSGTQQTSKLQKETVTGSISALTGTYTYGYSNADKASSANNSNGDDFAYSYDKGGNVTKATKNGSTTSTFFGYDRAGELCWSGTGTAAPSGQLGTTCAATPSGYTTLTSDHAGNNLGTTAAPNAYNGNSQAITNSGANQSFLDLGNNLRTGSGTTTFTNGPLGVTARKTSSGLTFTTRIPDGTILDEHGGGGTRYVLSDYQGSVSAIVNSSGTVYGSYLYDRTARPLSTPKVAVEVPTATLGVTLAPTTTPTAPAPTSSAPATTTPRATSQPDPTGLEQNTYTYAGGDPVSSSDPTGTIHIGGIFEACYGICLNLEYGADGEGHYGTIDVTGGPEAGVNTGVKVGTGEKESGFEDVVGWSVATPAGGLGGEFSTNGKVLAAAGSSRPVPNSGAAGDWPTRSGDTGFLVSPDRISAIRDGSRLSQVSGSLRLDHA